MNAARSIEIQNKFNPIVIAPMAADVVNRYDFYKGRRLQDWYHLEVVTHTLPEDQQHFEQGTSIWVTTSKEIFFCSRIHVEKRIKVGADSYSGLFTDLEVINCNYVSTSICQRIGGDIFA